MHYCNYLITYNLACLYLLHQALLCIPGGVGPAISLAIWEVNAKDSCEKKDELPIVCVHGHACIHVLLPTLTRY